MRDGKDRFVRNAKMAEIKKGSQQRGEQGRPEKLGHRAPGMKPGVIFSHVQIIIGVKQGDLQVKGEKKKVGKNPAKKNLNITGIAFMDSREWVYREI